MNKSDVSGSRAGALCDITIGNDVEFGFTAGDHEKGLDKARDLLREGASVVVYKMGERGAITVTADSEIKTGIYAAKALKPTGAGDSFMGGFIASLAANRSIEKSILRGSGVPVDQRLSLAANTAVFKYTIGTELRKVFGHVLRESVNRDVL